MLEWQPSWNGGHLGLVSIMDLAAILEKSLMEWWLCWLGSHLGGCYLAGGSHLVMAAILTRHPSWWWPPSWNGGRLINPVVAPLLAVAAILAQHPSSWRRPSCPSGHPEVRSATLGGWEGGGDSE